MASDYLTVREAAELLRIKERRLYDLARRGSLPSARVSGRWLFPRAALERFLAGQTHGAGAASAPRAQRPPVIGGSNDPLLDWALRESGCDLALMAEGSVAGIERFLRGEAVMAGTHLPPADPARNGNVLAVAGRDEAAGCVLLGWCRRTQGLVLPRGNPRQVRRLADLAGRPLASRQPGAGSQLLLEQLWAEAGLARERLVFAPGVARTQLELGLMVLEGRAEAGLAAEAAARSLNLDFLPLADELFDLLVARRDYFEPPAQTLFAFARTPAFAAKARALGGYDLAPLGQVRWNAP
jgi:putative molybdopterin biosynthesis protein